MRSLWTHYNGGLFIKLGITSIDDLLRIAKENPEKACPVKVTPEKTESWFDALKKKSAEELWDLGMREWQEGHWLFPHSWYDHIPENYIVVDIFGEEEPFIHGKSDDDQRFGMLPYGILGPTK